MSVRRALLLFAAVSVVVGVGFSGAAAAQWGGGHDLLNTVRGRAVRAVPAAKTPKVQAWTLGEYVKGKVHKVAVGSSFYGRSQQLVFKLSQPHENMNGFKWTIYRYLYCAASTFEGTVKSNGVASPEITIEKMGGAINGGSECIEQASNHPYEKQEGVFTPWREAAVRLKGLPLTLALAPPHEGHNEATLAPTSHFEFEVENVAGTATCKYFEIPKLKEGFGPGQPNEAAPLAVGNFSSGLSAETFTSECPEVASFGFDISGFAGPYGPALFVSYK
jgi:hypothetical protein